MTEPLPDHVIPALSRGTVDRAAHRRNDPAWLARAWADDRTRVLTVGDATVLVRDGGDGGDGGHGGSGTDAGPRLELRRPADAEAQAEAGGPRYFLGESDGVAYFAVRGATLAGSAAVRAASLREVGAVLSDRDAGLATHAVALDNWHATHRHCPRCGTPTEPTSGGHVRRCPADGSDHFPRTDPAVIMLVHDGGDRCVLGRQPSWPERRFSTLAGFVEPGESAEQAVAREVGEEVGLPVADVAYRASQPWPFPSSLMLAFRARTTGGRIALRDGELAEARWWSRAELRADAATGEVVLPPPVSVAHRLISDWLSGR